MTPLKAWSVISKNLTELYGIRAIARDTQFKGYSADEIEAEVICYEALRRMEEQEKSKE